MRGFLRAAGAAVLLALAACQPQPPPTSLAVAGSPLRVPLPAGWQATPGIGADLYLRPTEHGRPVRGAFLLVAHDEPRHAAPSLASYVDFKLEREARASPEQTLLRREPLRMSGHEALRVLRRMRGVQSTRMVWTQYVIADGRGWTLVASCEARDYPRLKGRFRRWLDGATVADDVRR